MGAKMLHRHLYRFLHHFNPLVRDISVLSFIKTGNHLVFQNIIKGLSIHRILIRRISVLLPVSDVPPPSFSIPFTPPSIEDTHVEDTVRSGFHAGSTARFKWSSGSVEPHIHSLNQASGNMDIVVFEKDDSIAHTRSPGKLNNAFDELLTFIVLGMGFACKNKLNRPGLGLNHGLQAIRIFKY